MRQELTDEIVNDPEGRGYAGMTDAQVADDINLVNRQRNRDTMSATEVLNAINKGEFNAFTAVDQVRVWDVLHFHELNPFGLEADLFVDIFGGGSATIVALQAIRVEVITRAQELGLGSVREGTVTRARL